MELDPLLVPFLAALNLDPSASLEQRRAGGIAAARRFVGSLTVAVPSSLRITDIVIPGNPAVPARVYTPDGEKTRAGLLFVHGGGWNTGSVETANEHCGALAAEADVVVVSVDYRLAPEHPYPAGLDDVSTALAWLARHAGEWGVDPARIAIGGASAGGNLAAAAVLRAREQHGPAIAFQLLEVPALDLASDDSSSWQEVNRVFPGLTDGHSATLDDYVPASVDRTGEYVSPLRAADLSGLPPALILAADVDPLRDDAIRYAERLGSAGVTVRSRVFPGIVHGTEAFTGLLPSAREWQAECVKALAAL